MAENNGRIDVLKDTMLFVTNCVLGNKIKESTPKEEILKMMPDIYEKADAKTIIKMLPYETYKALKELIEYIKTNDDIQSFIYNDKYKDTKYLEEAMIVVLRAKSNKHTYSLNPGVIEKLENLFTKENEAIAKRYAEIEQLTRGMLYSYGIVEFEFLRKQLSKYMGEILTEAELRDIFYARLNLNLFVNDYNVRWTSTNEAQKFVTYLNKEDTEIDIGGIVAGKKQGT